MFLPTMYSYFFHQSRTFCFLVGVLTFVDSYTGTNLVGRNLRLFMSCDDDFRNSSRDSQRR